LALLVLAALALGATTQVSVNFANAPASIDGAQLYFYDSGGRLIAKATVNGTTARATIDNANSYLVKLDAKTLYALFAFPSGSSAITFNFSNAAAINVTVKATGGFVYTPSGPIEYTAAITVGTSLVNTTVSSVKTLYATPAVRIWLPEHLLFPSVYGFKLTGITLNGAPVENGFTISTAGSYEIEATYEFSGLPWWVFAGIAALAVLLIAALAARGRSARTAMALAEASEWLEE